MLTVLRQTVESVAGMFGANFANYTCVEFIFQKREK